MTAGLGTAELVAHFEADHDDYQAIMTKALADRLAEGFAEWLTRASGASGATGPVRRLSADDLLAEKYCGIRPAFGYPACPDHGEKVQLFDLLDAGRAGIALTESCAMTPAASVSGLYFSHAEARYFNVGRIGRDQAAAYAARKQTSVEEVERWLGPNLAYDPARAGVTR